METQCCCEQAEESHRQPSALARSPAKPNKSSPRLRVTLHAPWPCACTATANAAIPMHSFIARPAAAPQPLVAGPRPSRVGGTIVAARPLLVAVPTSASLGSSQPARLFRWQGEPRSAPAPRTSKAQLQSTHARMPTVRNLENCFGERLTLGMGAWRVHALSFHGSQPSVHGEHATHRPRPRPRATRTRHACLPARAHRHVAVDGLCNVQETARAALAGCLRLRTHPWCPLCESVASATRPATVLVFCGSL